MTFTPPLLAHMLIASGLLLVAAHLGGYLFRALRQPQVIGEILGGLVLGPTVLGALWPAAHDWLWTGTLSTEIVLGGLYQVGLLLLMFCSGLEIRTSFEAGEKRTVGWLTVSGIALPFLLTIALAPVLGVSEHLGPAGSEPALIIVIGIAVAVTSIPVISRILHDLGVLDSSFARLVLAAAVVEDTVLYVLLAVALSLVGSASGTEFGLPALLGLESATPLAYAYHVGSTLIFFAAALVGGPLLFARLRRLRPVRDNNPVAMLILLLTAFSLAALALGIAPFLGAFAAGIAANRTGRDDSGGRETIKNFSFGFAIPIYFALVGLRLDLATQLDLIFFLGFLAYACSVKLASAYAGARLAGEGKLASFNLAVAMNARGGPGIVLASIAIDAGIIDDGFYASLVMLAIVTSCLAGSWLGWVLRRGWKLR